MAVRLRLRPVTVSGVASATPASGRYGLVPKNLSTAPVDRRLRGLVLLGRRRAIFATV